MRGCLSFGRSLARAFRGHILTLGAVEPVAFGLQTRDGLRSRADFLKWLHPSWFADWVVGPH